jgi:uncharacterized surface protein with fasciclin (FAS1) repeats
MKTLKFAAITLLSLAFVSCDDKDDTPMPDNNIADIVETNSSFSLLRQSLVKTNLLGTIRGASNITVFAPDNAAFAAAGLDSAAIAGLNTQTLANILAYHVVGSNIPSGSVPTSDSVRALNTLRLFASRNANGVFVNGIAVKQADVSASNGTIHVISNVLMPPTKTIADIATSDTTFSILAAAVQKAGLLAAIQGNGKYTVFAPTNAAFRQAGFANAAAINAADATLITNVVRLHVLPTNVFASDLINNSTAAALTGSVMIATSPARVKAAGSSNAYSNITTANVLATNGVVHVIDRVILP